MHGQSMLSNCFCPTLIFRNFKKEFKNKIVSKKKNLKKKIRKKKNLKKKKKMEEPSLDEIYNLMFGEKGIKVEEKKRGYFRGAKTKFMGNITFQK